MANYLLCYDISDPRRLQRVHRYVVKHALFVQLSVYYFQGNRQALNRLLSGLSCIIEEKEDDVRVYRVRNLLESLQIGRSWLPEGIGFAPD